LFLKKDSSKNRQRRYATVNPNNWEFPLWLRSLSVSVAGFKLPFGLVLFTFLGMLSWSLFYDLEGVDMNVWDESLFAMRAYQLYENGAFLQNFNQFDGLYDHPSTKLPFVTLVQAASFYLFGPSVWALRLPVGFIAIVSILLMTRILFRLGIGSKWGLLMGLLIVSSSNFLGEHMLRTGDHDAPLAFFLILSGLYFFEYITTERKASIWGLCFWFLAALLTKNILAGVVVPAWLLFAVISGKVRFLITDRRLYAAALGVLGIYAAVLAGFEMAYPGFFNRMWNYELMGRYTEVIEGHTGPWYYYVDLLFKEDFMFLWVTVTAAFLAVLGYVIRMGWRRFQLQNLGVGGSLFFFVFLVGAVYLAVISHSQTKLPWYHAPLFPMMGVWAVLGLRSIWGFGGFRVWRFGGFGVVRFLGFGIVGLGLLGLWFSTGVKAHSRTTIFGTKGYVSLFSVLNKKDLLMPHTFIVEDDFGSDTYFYVKSFAENANNKESYTRKDIDSGSKQFHFTRDIDSLKVGAAVLIKKPWILQRIDAQFETENILKLEDVQYRKIKARRSHTIPNNGV
jgi:4-amino-4-deoxy-L-arabinose transferase-like glycosyltransferase